MLALVGEVRVGRGETELLHREGADADDRRRAAMKSCERCKVDEWDCECSEPEDLSCEDCGSDNREECGCGRYWDHIDRMIDEDKERAWEDQNG